MNRICLCLNGKTLKENLNYIELDKLWIDMAELRVDCLEQWDVQKISNFVNKCSIPLIITCRRTEDGGFFTNNQETFRQQLLWDLMELPVQYVDLERDLTDKKWTQRAALNKIKIIRSIHDFEGLPKDLNSFLKNVDKNEISKCAVTLKNPQDYKNFLEIYCNDYRDQSIVLAMGAQGFFSRILGPLYSNHLSYVSPLTAANLAAPGQVDAKTLCELYRFKELDHKWKVLGIIGNTLGHSRSPHIHNRWLKNDGYNAVYVPFLLDDIKSLKYLQDYLPLQGLSVTIPYKLDVITYSDEHSHRVDRIGACNTLYKDKGSWKGENTDAPGFLKPLLEKMACSDLLDVKVTVIGAGGAARGVVFALVEAGADLLILNRTEEKARALAEEFEQKWAPLNKDSLEKIKEHRKIIVQTTGVGMSPLIDGNPLAFYDFQGDEMLYDIIYNPEETRLMKRAQKAGAVTLGGFPMLEEQARLQFKLFTLELDRQN
ncbi:MAG: type I 3-dehydroquinate dehydratase [Spirochaetaceae bacterium]|jgi:3-dehydroquinate dehydratase/shikimate dehydrogenase|nr:type I 3-dehydroquinate dehydratase [Spirochaetaceae bacterium]